MWTRFIAVLSIIGSVVFAGCGVHDQPTTIASADKPAETSANTDAIAEVTSSTLGGDLVESPQREALTTRLAKVHEASGEEKALIVADIATWLTTRSLEPADIELAERTMMMLDRDPSGLAQEFARQVGNTFESLSSIDSNAAWIAGWAQRQLLLQSPINIEGQTIQGDSFDWNAYRGKLVLIEFWATWCGPCHDQMAEVLALYDQYHDDGFDVVGIATDENLAVVQSFVRNADLPWTTIHSPANGDSSLSRQFGVRLIPTNILVDRRGNVVSLQPYGEELEQLLAAEFGR